MDNAVQENSRIQGKGTRKRGTSSHCAIGVCNQDFGKKVRKFGLAKKGKEKRERKTAKDSVMRNS